MGKFGFGDDGGDEIKLPPPKKTSKGSKKAAKTEVENAVRAGEQLGFVNRTQPKTAEARATRQTTGNGTEVSHR